MIFQLLCNIINFFLHLKHISICFFNEKKGNYHQLKSSWLLKDSHHLRKYMENSMKNMHSDVEV